MTASCIFQGAMPNQYPESPRYFDGSFKNVKPREGFGLGETAKIMWDFAFNKPDGTVPEGPIPVREMSHNSLMQAPDHTFYRLGHSNLLFKINGEFWMTDPVFSERASPVQWAGPKRFHQPPISIENLPPLTGVIISHDHYDHLDKAAIEQLAKKVEKFYVPLGVGDRMIDWGVPVEKVEQFDWWQSGGSKQVKVTATPAQHFSGRGLSDGNKTLWASWVIETGTARIFFSGDSGYFDGFKTIGEKFGSFDITFVETGAYNPRWFDMHMHPVESVQAHIDLRGKVMMPIHNGTFDLAMHTWFEPMELAMSIAQETGVRLTTPEMGEATSLLEPTAVKPWWQQVDQAGEFVAKTPAVTTAQTR